MVLRALHVPFSDALHNLHFGYFLILLFLHIQISYLIDRGCILVVNFRKDTSRLSLLKRASMNNFSGLVLMNSSLSGFGF